MFQTANLGYPRFGAKRELKQALEGYWKKKLSKADFLRVCSQIREQNWRLQHEAGLDFIPSNDFSPYDQILDMVAVVGAVPRRYGWQGGEVDLDTYFAMARGSQSSQGDVPPMEMTKWFDTNYHYTVPEFEPRQKFSLASLKPVEEFLEAKALGITTRPVLIGPVSFLLLGKSTAGDHDRLSLLNGLLEVYEELLAKLSRAGAGWVQIDEPCLVLDLDEPTRQAFKTAYERLTQYSRIQIMLTTYFGELGENVSLAASLPVAGLHVDLVRAPQQLADVLRAAGAKTLSLGVIDGRNVWRTDLDAVLRMAAEAAASAASQNVILAPSCSLLFCPYDLDLETKLDAEMRTWLAFSRQKLGELQSLKRALNDQDESGLQANRAAIQSRASSTRIHNAKVAARIGAITPEMTRRKSDHAQRKAAQAENTPLPPFPTTTIGSFPQTKEVRAKRAAFRKGEIELDAYEKFLEEETERTIRFQEEIGLDVLVHGEFERTDMVEYFGEQLDGFAFTEHGWVQSYGSRGVRPPIIYGDVSRPQPMTVRWSVFAQSLSGGR